MVTEPVQYAGYTHAIKVTVDGPREPRRKSPFRSHFVFLNFLSVIFEKLVDPDFFTWNLFGLK